MSFSAEGVVTVKKEETELRVFNCELNPLSRSDGSAMISQGGTCVLAAMAGPVEVKLQNLKIDKAYVECTYRPRAGICSIQDKIREHNIQKACEACILTTMHPRTMISVQLQELQDRGGLDACAINAACLSLIMGSVPMKCLVAGVQCIIDRSGRIIVDPDQCQTFEQRASFLFVFESVEKNLVIVSNTGTFSMKEFIEAESICRKASEVIFQFYRSAYTKFCANNLAPISSEEAAGEFISMES